jgi:hypothetical protein
VRNQFHSTPRQISSACDHGFAGRVRPNIRGRRACLNEERGLDKVGAVVEFAEWGWSYLSSRSSAEGAMEAVGFSARKSRILATCAAPSARA